MGSPFPGVDPYIEMCDMWTGFRNALITHCSELLNGTLPTQYAAFVEKRVELVEVNDEQTKQRVPDNGIAREIGFGARGTVVAVMNELEPATLTLPEFEESPEAYIDIRSLPDRELITCIEILSPSNKSASGHGEYWTKRAAMIRQGVNLVEIDLLLEGRRLPAMEPLPVGDFYAFVSRGNRRPRSDVYSWSIRRVLPKLPIPLKPPDADVSLDLSQAYAMTFNGGRFDRTLRYEIPAPAVLSEAERAWVGERLKAKPS